MTVLLSYLGAKCKDPGSPEHGRRDGSLFLLGTQVRFSCDDGYELVGLNSLQCVPLCSSCRTVRWNGTTPTCEKNGECLLRKKSKYTLIEQLFAQ